MIHWPLRCLWIVAAVAILAECAQLPAQQQPAQQQPTEQSSSSEQLPVAQPPNGQPSPGSPVTGQQPAQTSVGSPQGQQAGSFIPCYLIEDGKDFKKWVSCQFASKYPHLGNGLNFVVLDFTPATEEDIKTLLGRFPPKTALQGGIKLVNSKIETLDLGNITKLIGIAAVPENALFIEISHNMKLQSIKWNLEDFTAQRKVQILIYNNPNLTLDPKLKDQLLTQATPNSYIQENSTECMFARPTADGLYRPPNDELLKKCETVKGDLQLEKRTLSNDLTMIEAGCLRLVDVNMENSKINIGSLRNGTLECKDGKTSNITDNKGLCGDKLKILMQYFPPSITVPVKLDDSCTSKTCDQAGAAHMYIHCEEITAAGDVDISAWFAADAVDKKSKLELATNAILKIEKSQMTTLSLTKLTKAKGLVITGNPNLVDLDLANLEVETLKIENNANLLLEKLKQLKVTVDKRNESHVECRTSAGLGIAPLEIKDIRDLHYCTHIIGPLVLKNLMVDIDEGKVFLKDINGCIRIEDTQLTKLNFLANTKIHGCDPTVRHQMTNNPNLCNPEEAFPQMGNIIFTGGKAVGCGTVCRSLKAGCTSFYGDLKISSSKDIANLDIIHGSLVIDGTDVEVLEFPNLKEIKADKVPALQITNNKKLTSLRMPNIKKIEVKGNGKPVVKITGNTHLKNLNSFLPPGMKCSDSPTATCYHEPVIIEPESNNAKELGKIIGIAIGGCVLVSTACGVVYVYCVRHKIPNEMKKRREQRRREQKRLQLVEAKAREAVQKSKKKKDYVDPLASESESDVEQYLRNWKFEEKEDLKKTWKSTAKIDGAIAGPMTRCPNKIELARNIYGPGRDREPDAYESFNVDEIEEKNNDLDKTQLSEKSTTKTVTTNLEATQADDDMTKTATIEPADRNSKTAMLPPMDMKIDQADTYLKDARIKYEKKIGSIYESIFTPIWTGLTETNPKDFRRILYQRMDPKSSLDVAPPQDMAIFLSRFVEAENNYIHLDPGCYQMKDEEQNNFVSGLIGEVTERLANRIDGGDRSKRPVLNVFHVGGRKLHVNNKSLNTLAPKENGPSLPIKNLHENVLYTKYTKVHLNTGKSEADADLNVVDIILKDVPDFKFTENGKLPWLAFFDEALKQKAIIVVTSTKYYFFVQLLAITHEYLYKGAPNFSKTQWQDLSNFGLVAFQNLVKSYNPDYVPVDAFFMWSYHILSIAHDLYVQRSNPAGIVDTFKSIVNIVKKDEEKDVQKDVNKAEMLMKCLVDITVMNETVNTALYHETNKIGKWKPKATITWSMTHAMRPTRRKPRRGDTPEEYEKRKAATKRRIANDLAELKKDRPPYHLKDFVGFVEEYNVHVGDPRHEEAVGSKGRP